MVPKLTAEQLDELLAADGGLIGMHLANRHRVSGAIGLALARDIRDVIVALRREAGSPEDKMEGPALYRCRCGSSAIYIVDKDRPRIGRVQCSKCGVRTEGGEALYAAAEHWNRFVIGGQHERAG